MKGRYKPVLPLMNYGGNAVLYRVKAIVKGDWFSSCAFVCLLTLFTTAFLISVSLYGAARDNRAEALREIGAGFSVCANPQYPAGYGGEDAYGPFDADILERIGAMEHVAGTEAMSALSMADALPVGFRNSRKHTGEDPERQQLKEASNETVPAETREIYSRSVNIVGCSHVELFDYFRRGISTVEEGEFPDESRKGALISRELADENGLKIGSRITVRPYTGIYEEDQGKAALAVQEREEMDLPVVGIYATGLHFHVTEQNGDSDLIYRISPYNTIFTDYETGCAAAGNEPEILFFDVLVDDPGYLEEVIAKIRELPIDWKKYMIFNDMESFYRQYAGQIEGLIRTTGEMLAFTLTAGTGIYILAMILLGRRRRTECLAARTLGETAGHYIRYRTIETAVLAAGAILLSLIAAPAILEMLEVPLAPRLVSADRVYTVSYFELGENDFVPEIRMGLSFLTAGLGLLYGGLLTAAAAAIAGLYAGKLFRKTYKEGEGR